MIIYQACLEENELENYFVTLLHVVGELSLLYVVTVLLEYLNQEDLKDGGHMKLFCASPWTVKYDIYSSTVYTFFFTV